MCAQMAHNSNWSPESVIVVGTWEELICDQGTLSSFFRPAALVYCLFDELLFIFRDASLRDLANPHSCYMKLLIFAAAVIIMADQLRCNISDAMSSAASRGTTSTEQCQVGKF